MANFGSIRSRVLKLLNDHSMIATADVNTLIQAEHDELLEIYSWSRRKGDTMVNLVGPYTTGTVTTVGAVVTGSGTTFTAAMVNRWMRIGSNTFFHRISAFTSATSLTLEAALPSDVTTATSYTIFQHVYALPSTFGRMVSVTGDIQLFEWARTDLDRVDPYRTVRASRPEVYSLRGLDGSGNFQIEFWPVPSGTLAIRMEYLQTNSLSADADTPLYRSDVLVWKSAESGCFFLSGKTGDRVWLDLADRYHARYQEALQEAKEDDRGKFSTVSYIRDRSGDFGPGRSDDFWLARDPLRGR